MRQYWRHQRGRLHHEVAEDESDPFHVSIGGAVPPSPGRELRRRTRALAPRCVRFRRALRQCQHRRAHLQVWRCAVPWQGHKTPTSPAPTGCPGSGRGCITASSRAAIPQSLWQRAPRPPDAHRPAAPRGAPPSRGTASTPVCAARRSPAAYS